MTGNKRLRLAIATQTYDPPLNGQGVFCLNLSEGLARARHEVLVLTPSQDRQADCRSHGEVQVQAIPSLGLPFASGARATRWPRGARGSGTRRSS